MERIENDMQKVSLRADKITKSPAGHESSSERLTHKSLPKLVIDPYYGPLPEEVPADKVQWFMDYMSTYYRPPPSSAFLPFPVLPAGRKSNNGIASTYRPIPPNYPKYSRWNAVDPYDVDLPTPLTLQFTENEAFELQQWREVVGELRESHSEALERLLSDPKDANAKGEVRKLARARAEMVENIASIHDRRQIRRNFRKDFNHIIPGW